MENENPSLDELEAEIALHHRRIAFVKADPVYAAEPELREAVADLEKIVAELEDAVAAKHAEQLLREAEEDRLIKATVVAHADLREALIGEILLPAENSEQMLKIAAEIRAIERLYDEYEPADWERIAHLLPPIE